MAKIKWESKEDEQKRIQEQEAARLEKESLETALKTIPPKVSTLEEENMMLMMASAETYEQMYNENMALMLAVAEMYEELQILKGGSV